ncbi:MAG: OB-fold domain-containing protein [Acidimicrobiia bacterium]
MSTDAPTRPLPALTPETEFFWTSGVDGRLRFLRCGDCYSYVHPPAPVCPQCASRSVAPEPVTGRGTVATFTVNHQDWGLMDPPYVIAIVELVEQPGLRLTTNLVNVEAGAVAGGMAVQVCFEQVDDVWFPLFEPAT